MRRTGAVALLATAALGLLALVAMAVSDKRELAFTIGVVPSIVAADLRSGAQVCQGPIAVPEEFTHVLVRAGSPGRPGPPLKVTVLGDPVHEVLGQGRFRAGYADPTEQSVAVGRVAGEQRIAVCVRNRGRDRVGLYGNAGAAAPTSRAFVGNRGARHGPDARVRAFGATLNAVCATRGFRAGKRVSPRLGGSVAVLGARRCRARRCPGASRSRARRCRAPYARPVALVSSRALSAARSPAST